MKLRRKKKEKPREIPPEWFDAKKLPKDAKIFIVHEKPKKIRIPGLRTGKRILACLLFIANILFALTSVIMVNVVVSLFFWGTAWILLDYVWKTRKQVIEWEGEK